MFRKVMIANRGEIAVRVIRACRELGIDTVSVYSDQDESAPFVRMSSETYALEGQTSAETYLNIDQLLTIARASGCDAVHPGYGFLSERPSFARAVADSGMTFIGPSPESMERMGDKLNARATMIEAGVPVVPGGGPEDAARIGYPLLVKAAFGGGGKGMRVVREPADLEAAVRQASNEATSAFGDGTVYLERYLERPRHIEVQIFGDAQGNVIHLGERECSIQRRHQKLIEESPSPTVDDRLRARLGEAAVKAASSVGYQNAGTVEFLLEDDAFFFLEMNTRLQVEHPVTEMVTGIDLVKLQLAVADGASLPYAQQDIRLRGHSIECRICAEDPYNNFIPSPGLVVGLKSPEGPFVRVDSGIDQRFEVTMSYDSMISKLIVWAPTRAEAIQRMDRALKEYLIVGFQTSIPFHRDVMANAAFRAGDLSIRFIEEQMGGGMPDKPKDQQLARLIACALEHDGRRSSRTLKQSATRSLWKMSHRSRMGR